jgi:transposase
MDMIIALDLHRDFSRALIVNAELEVLRDERISHDSKEPLSQYFCRFDPGTPVVMEATFNWPWVAELAASRGLSPHLADCKTARLRSGKSKSDRLDALWLARLWFSKGLFPHCYLPSKQQQSQRDLYRHRKLLVGIRSKLKNNTHGFLFRQGVNLAGQVSDLFGNRGRSLMEATELPESDSLMLQRKLEAIDSVAAQISQSDRLIKAFVYTDEQCRLLMTIPGVGELTAYGILSEIGEVSRFANGRALASYAGVLPRLNESADKDLGRHTGGDCNRHLRHLAIETVTGAIRGSSRFRSLHSRISARNRNAGSKARVAVARKVMETAWIVLSRKVEYQERPLPSKKLTYRVSPAPLSA